MSSQLQIQNQPPNQKPQLGVRTDLFTTDLSLATPGFAIHKSTGRQVTKRFLEENPRKVIMSRNSNGNGNGPRLELKLNLSPKRAVGLGLGPESPARSIDSVSPPSSCLSSELSQDEAEPATSVMVVVGCPRCLMYVMMPDDVDSKCPRCKSHVLLDVMKDPSAAGVANDTVAGVIACSGAKRIRKS